MNHFLRCTYSSLGFGIPKRLFRSYLHNYDDACHLKRFVNSRQKTAAGKFLASLTMVVDKMHFKNHVDKWCKQNVNQHKVPEFYNLNIEACEKTSKICIKIQACNKTYDLRKLRFVSFYDV